MTALDLMLLVMPFALAPLAIAFTCCCASCANCNNNASPAQIQVDIAGITNAVCTTCADFNATYICTRDPANDCQWVYTSATPTCSGNYPSGVSVTVSFDGSNRLVVVLRGLGASPTSSHSWRESTPDGPSSTWLCDSWSAKNVPFLSSGSTYCTANAFIPTTCAVTSL